MKRFPDILLVVIGLGTILCCSLSATGLFRNSAKQTKVSPPVILPASEMLRSGDIIFRDGKSFISQAFKQFRRKDQRFSHAGIIHIQNGDVFVFHCIGGEGSSDNRMRKEKLSSFCSGKEVNEYAIFRPSLNISQMRAIDSIACGYFDSGLEFDTKFDLHDSRKMYCTELIYNVFKLALQDENFIPLTEVAGLSYVACDNIFLQPELKEIYSYSYHQHPQKQKAIHETSYN
ncbi:MAG: hypothetical protein EYC69_03935 [Bacteroidetes bacterium]|nr:MAG: hypothetical protein EYC69_03935 [Bacteroidota bacterium]